jgi:hypothetical protein
MVRRTALLTTLIAALGAAGAQAADAPALTSEGWHFLVGPYMWGINTKGDLALGPVSSDFELPVSTALEQLKGAFQARAEARNHRFGLAADFTHLEVAKGGAFSLPLPDGSTTDGDLALRIQFLEAWPYYRLGGDTNAFDVFLGIRYNSFRTELDFRELGRSASRQRNWTDPVVGARWVGQLRPSLALSARADLGGFGAGSELAVNVQGGLHWQFSRVAGLVVQYRWMKLDYEAGEESAPDFFKFEPSMHGVVLGVPFSW